MKKLDIAEKKWLEMKQKYVDDWHPTENDIDWLIKTMESLNAGGKWTIPAVGATFEKVGYNHLRLESIVTDNILNALISIEKTKKVGEKASIKVDIEKAADHILICPPQEDLISKPNEQVLTTDKKNMQVPSRKEVFQFMVQKSHPYKFEYVKDSQPLRVSIERKTIYVNEDVMMAVIEDLVKATVDWKGVMRKNLLHEKAHEKFIKWNRKWHIGAEECGWLASYLTDILIDKIYFAENSNYRKWLLVDSRHTFEGTSKQIWDIFSTVATRPRFLYNQAAYWVSVGAITLDQAVDIYPEKADYIVEMSQLFNKIRTEEDLEWAFPKAMEIYTRQFQM